MMKKTEEWNELVENGWGIIENKGELHLEQFDWSLETRAHQIFPQVISKEHLLEKAADIPFCTWNNLAIVFRILLYEDENELCTALVTGKILNAWGINEQELYRIAMQNAVQYAPVTIRGLRELVMEQIAENLGCRGDRMPVCEDTPYAYVANCGKAAFGATCIIYPDFAEKALTALGQSFYILPSSIHEVILVPDELSIPGEELKRMVRKINVENLYEEERLSDEIYYCNLKTGIISLYNEA